MRVSKIRWVSHSKSTILSVDVQPSGYRFITGGADAYVRVWNLMPVISYEHEMEGEDNDNSDQDEPSSVVPGAGVDPSEENSLSKNVTNSRKSGSVKGNKPAEDRKMHEDGDNNNSDGERSESDDGLTPEERLKQEHLAAEYAKDTKLMESLFPDEASKAKRLLATLEGHQAPINCVRWNNLGTIFASADDEGTINLWQYRGKTVISAYQAQAFGVGNTNKSGGLEEAKAAFAKEADGAGDKAGKVDDDAEFEDWAVLKRCRGHRGTISDVAWSPDNLHFASCSTDSTICIWDVNEHAPIKVLDAKANGLTFDPFGKFIASQSSEDKKLTIWRIQNFKNITKEGERDVYYRQQQQSMSLFRRLSWSSDGAFIATTGGKDGANNIAPMIERTSWNLSAALSGHSKPISVSRINPTLYKAPGSSSNLSCYSIIALASAESTITVWKPSMAKPLAILMDAFMMGITDLSWGFNGNILLASSTDGKVMAIHFKPNLLGTPLTEAEKRIIVQNKYGRTVLDEYVKNKRVQSQNQNLSQLSANAVAVGATLQQNQPQKEPPKQQVITNTVTGKKKIVPVMCKSFAGPNAKIDPSINPFANQQLGQLTESQVVAASMAQPSTQTGLGSSNKAENQSNLVKNTQKQPEQSAGTPADVQMTEDQGAQALSTAQQATSNIQTTTTLAKQSAVQDQAQASAIAAESMAAQAQAMANRGGNNAALEASTSAAVKDIFMVRSLDQINKQMQVITREDIQITLSATDPFSDEMRVIVSNQGAIQNSSLVMPVSAISQGPQAQIKVYNCLNQEVTSSFLYGNVIAVTANSLFYALYTTKSQLSIYSSCSTQVIKERLQLDNVCMLASTDGRPDSSTDIADGTSANTFVKDKVGRLCTISLRGMVSLFKVKDERTLQSCMLEWQASLAEPLKARNQHAQQVFASAQAASDHNPSTMMMLNASAVPVVHVDDLKVGSDGTVIVFFSDKTRFEYHVPARTWREINPDIELGTDGSSSIAQKGQDFPVATTSGQKITSSGLQLSPEDYMGPSSSLDTKTSSLVDLISRLDTSAKRQIQKLNSTSQRLASDVNEEVKGDGEAGARKDNNNQEGQVPSQATKNGDQAALNMSLTRGKLAEMQEAVDVYERLNLKSEYLYAYRMLIFLLLQMSDFNALAKELNKFIGGQTNDSSSAVRITLTKLWNGQSPNDHEREKGVILRCGEGLIACGLDRVRVFQHCVVPPLREFYTGEQTAAVIDRLLKVLANEASERNMDTEMQTDTK